MILQYCPGVVTQGSKFIYRKIKMNGPLPDAAQHRGERDGQPNGDRARAEQPHGIERGLGFGRRTGNQRKDQPRHAGQQHHEQRPGNQCDQQRMQDERRRLIRPRGALPSRRLGLGQLAGHLQRNDQRDGRGQAADPARHSGRSRDHRQRFCHHPGQLISTISSTPPTTRSKPATSPGLSVSFR